MRSALSCWRPLGLSACTIVIAAAWLIANAHAQESRLGIVQFPREFSDVVFIHAELDRLDAQRRFDARL
jgi:hypothetical protein